MPYEDLIKGRLSIGGGLYSITAVSYRRVPVFDSFYLARIVINNLREIHDQGMVASLCWVVMPDHLHWLFELKANVTLAAVMQKLKGRSAKQINFERNTIGKVWQAGYYEHALRSEEGIGDIARYIVANPLRAGLVGSLKEYPHWDAVWL